MYIHDKGQKRLPTTFLIRFIVNLFIDIYSLMADVESSGTFGFQKPPHTQSGQMTRVSGPDVSGVSVSSKIEVDFHSLLSPFPFWFLGFGVWWFGWVPGKFYALLQ